MAHWRYRRSPLLPTPAQPTDIPRSRPLPAAEHDAADDRDGDGAIGATDTAARAQAVALLRAPWARPRMWEQYAENHTGACLVLQRDRFVQEVEQLLTRVGRLRRAEVRYTLGGSPQPGRLLLLGSHKIDYRALKVADWAATSPSPRR